MCKQLAQRRMDSLTACGQFGDKALQASCALALLDTLVQSQKIFLWLFSFVLSGKCPWSALRL